MANHEKGRRAPLGALARCRRGLSTVEYIIILTLIAVGGIALWSAFGDAVEEKIGSATSQVSGME